MAQSTANGARRCFVTSCVLLTVASVAHADDVAGEWGKPIDGLACRLVLESRYVVGQPIMPVIEIKNLSARKRYIATYPWPYWINAHTFELTGPKGSLTRAAQNRGLTGAPVLEPIGPGQVKRVEASDLRDHYHELHPFVYWPTREGVNVPAGKYVARFRFTCPKMERRMVSGFSIDAGQKILHYKEMPPEWVADHWAGELTSAPVAFQLAALGKDDLTVHEWGVFTVFNDVKVANANRREEWGGLPSFFYRQFPNERLRWVPAAWDKPIVYFYAKPASLHLSVKVSFAKGVPVVWWPAVADPVDDGGYRTARDPRAPRPFRALTWDAWLGQRVPSRIGAAPRGGQLGKPAWVEVDDFPLPKDSWLRQARLPDATRLTVIGNIEERPKPFFPGAKDRPETERFLYYDGLVPAPDSLRCVRVDAATLTLHNTARFDIERLFVVDRRVKGTVGFSSLDGVAPLKAGARLTLTPKRVDAGTWPASGVKEMQWRLLRAGLFAPEAEALLKIWRQRLFEADGITVFYLLPAAEYDRMLPLSILPAPAVPPVRVGIALHPHMEVEPELAARVAPLIRELDDEDFAKRSAAGAALLEIGPHAFSLLRDELHKPLPLEVRRRIEGILDRVDASIWLDLRKPKKDGK